MRRVWDNPACTGQTPPILSVGLSLPGHSRVSGTDTLHISARIEGRGSFPRMRDGQGMNHFHWVIEGSFPRERDGLANRSIIRIAAGFIPACAG